LLCRRPGDVVTQLLKAQSLAEQASGDRGIIGDAISRLLKDMARQK
jgi:hypothetical protein